MVLKFTEAQFQTLINKKKGKVSKPSKYRNVKVDNADGKFDSKKEYNVFKEFELMLKSGEVIDIKKQVEFVLIPSYPEIGERAVKYKADLVVTYSNGFQEVIDVKSKITKKNPDYIIKRKLMWHVHKIKIREIIR